MSDFGDFYGITSWFSFDCDATVHIIFGSRFI